MTTPEQQQKRKARLISFLTEGLPTLPRYVFELNTLLSSTSVDLKRVAKVIRNDPSMSAQVIRLCNSALFSLRRRVPSIEEAAVLMGSERLRTLVLTCSVMEFTSRQLPRGEGHAHAQIQAATTPRRCLQARLPQNVGCLPSGFILGSMKNGNVLSDDLFGFVSI